MNIVKYPGVYIREGNALPHSVGEVATAVPAFVGYTQKAVDGNMSLTGKPFRINSMAEYHNHFGQAPLSVFSVVKVGSGYNVENPEPLYTFYYNLQLFYANGGGLCYIVSVGDYEHGLDKDAVIAGIDALTKEQEPTILVVPEAVNFPNRADCAAIQQAMLRHCGGVMKNRFALLDVFDGMEFGPENVNIENFRTDIGEDFLAFGGAYFPWINTSVISERNVNYQNLKWDVLLEDLKTVYAEWPENTKALVDGFGDCSEKDKQLLHSILLQKWDVYRQLLDVVRRRLNLMPLSAAMAGIYTMVDNTRGVWKAPANVTVNSVVTPSVNITNREQQDLNVPLSGKAINAIRFFPGDGIKVWGARTLDGNSLEWRYINILRTMIFLEESVKNAARAYVSEPNNAGTWLNMRNMIEGLLLGVWKRGGLAGSSPEDAFSVHVDLGDTMTPEDILEGIMRITVLVAISHPSEFIEITFQQQMQA